MIREERRLRAREPAPLSRVEERPGGFNPLDQIIHREESAKRSLLYERILRLIRTRNSFLSDRERKVMALYYFEGLPLRLIASYLNITAEHAAVILFRSRRRIAELFKGTV
jgi:RNA polymerase sigma factor (sigma-70 family)